MMNIGKMSAKWKRRNFKMKPLTIEQLKSLEVGDWVWIIDFEKTVYKPISDSGNYYRINDSGEYADKELWCYCSAIGHGFDYSDYGKTWLAYKNKEQAEAKGEIVELPCIRKVTADNMEKYHVYYIGRCGLYENAITYDWCDTYKQAECRLAELKSEK